MCTYYCQDVENGLLAIADHFEHASHTLRSEEEPCPSWLGQYHCSFCPRQGCLVFKCQQLNEYNRYTF